MILSGGGHLPVLCGVARQESGRRWPVQEAVRATRGADLGEGQKTDLGFFDHVGGAAQARAGQAETEYLYTMITAARPGGRGAGLVGQPVVDQPVGPPWVGHLTVEKIDH
jgi:hypothetical protein